MIELRAADAVARIAPPGAELQALRLGGRDLLRVADAAWPATCPILFPIVGWARDGAIRVDGTAYPMGVHGFAAARHFTCIAQAPDTATFLLRDDAQTHVHYPFGFELQAIWRLAADSLSVTLAVTNTGDAPLPYACGLHPGFRWPFAGGAPEDYAVTFDDDERADVPLIAPGGLFSDERRPVPLRGRTLPLSHDLLAQEALCFLNLRSRGLRFGRPGAPRLRVELDDFPHVALWTRPPSPFLSIEAWTAYGDPVGFSGDLHDKPSMRLLAPGAEARHMMRLGLEG